MGLRGVVIDLDLEELFLRTQDYEEDLLEVAADHILELTTT